MKRFFVLLSFVLVFCTACTNQPYNFTMNDCIEDGICKEGLTVIDNGLQVTITKKYCLKHNYKWDEKTHTCYVR